ncbi:MAG: hypothetical protein U5K84_05740 [Alkalibacterium sp.]|nr:hypothetical protein [Alkalibacterium sp.]
MIEEPAEGVEEQIERARVLEVEQAEGAGLDEGFYTEILSVRLEFTSGEYDGEVVESFHYLTGNPSFDFDLSPGDNVLVNVEDINAENGVHIVEYVRDTYIYIVLGAFVALLLLLGGKKGFRQSLP